MKIKINNKKQIQNIDTKIFLITYLINKGLTIPHYCYHNELSIAGKSKVVIVSSSNLKLKMGQMLTTKKFTNIFYLRRRSLQIRNYNTSASFLLKKNKMSYLSLKIIQKRFVGTEENTKGETETIVFGVPEDLEPKKELAISAYDLKKIAGDWTKHLDSEGNVQSGDEDFLGTVQRQGFINIKDLVYGEQTDPLIAAGVTISAAVGAQVVDPLVAGAEVFEKYRIQKIAKILALDKIPYVERVKLIEKSVVDPVTFIADSQALPNDTIIKKIKESVVKNKVLMSEVGPNIINEIVSDSPLVDYFKGQTKMLKIGTGVFLGGVTLRLVFFGMDTVELIPKKKPKLNVNPSLIETSESADVKKSSFTKVPPLGQGVQANFTTEPSVLNSLGAESGAALAGSSEKAASAAVAGSTTTSLIPGCSSLSLYDLRLISNISETVPYEEPSKTGSNSIISSIGSGDSINTKLRKQLNIKFPTEFPLKPLEVEGLEIKVDIEQSNSKDSSIGSPKEESLNTKEKDYDGLNKG